ncbi:ATP-binding cassette domain-containing protein [Streptomyces sp. V1I6]|uniref:ATP-binding cassette domain-containing protein n=1 Tax=Streptomyces sp. V1I6 TaxID=3042273 RepID=UPI00278149BE|nr:ATP-binding cassette domain-containing protein [Streptomyces sp. V1I6]MDQ0841384.1 ABC-type multidrug transport system ATPase subunit [Streptomyces sp. V1I6]
MVDGLVKKCRDRDRPAVDGLSFSVRREEVVGFLGPNGAGRTTTLGILTSRVAPRRDAPPRRASMSYPAPRRRAGPCSP